MKHQLLGLLVGALLSTNALAQSDAPDTFNDRFAAATQRSAAFEPTKEMKHVETGPSNYVHPLDRVIEQRLIDLRAHLHAGAVLDDLPYTWNLSVWKWPVISAQLDGEEPDIRSTKEPSPGAIAAAPR